MDELDNTPDELVRLLPQFAAELIVHSGGAAVVDAAIVVAQPEAHSADRPRPGFAVYDRCVSASGLRLVDACAFGVYRFFGLDLHPSAVAGTAAVGAVLSLADDALEPEREESFEALVGRLLSRYQRDVAVGGVLDAVAHLLEECAAL
jgi:hypothetical protein